MLALSLGGIPTLLNAPLALTPADLKAAKVDVALMGVPADVSYARCGRMVAAAEVLCLLAGGSILSREKQRPAWSLSAERSPLLRYFAGEACGASPTSHSLPPRRALVFGSNNVNRPATL